ncbi:MAG: DUF4383 domain-containing protein [bacterium]
MSTTRPHISTAPSPGASTARLWCLVVGAFLLLTGVVGFFYTADFGTGSAVASTDVYGVLASNGWDNLAFIALGAPLLFAARDHAPLGALVGAITLLVIVVLGIAALGESGIPFVAEDGRLIDLLPVSTFDVSLYAVLAALGLWAWRASRVSAP